MSTDRGGLGVVIKHKLLHETCDSSRAERLACDSVGGNKELLLKVGIVVGIVRKG